MILTGITYRELWEFELALDPEIAALAAERCSAEFASRLEEHLARTSTVLEDTDELTNADVEFHTLVAEATENRALQLARTPTIALLYPAYHNVIQTIAPGERLLHAHREIVRAIVAKESEQAREWMRKHIVDFRRGLELAGVDLEAPVPQPRRRRVRT